MNPMDDAQEAHDFIYIEGPDVTAEDCRKYKSGHGVHFIQVRLASEERRVAAEVTAVDGHYIDFRTEAGTQRRWNHDPQRLLKVQEIAARDPEARTVWSERYHLLTVYSEEPSGSVVGTPVTLAPSPTDCGYSL